MKRLRIYQFLISNIEKQIHQSTISKACQCTPEYTCKVLKKLQKDKIIEKNHRNSLVVKNPLMLCFLTAHEKKLPPPIMYKTAGFSDVINVLRQTIYSLTLDSAVKIRQDENPKIVHAYVLGKDTELISNNFQKTQKNPDLIVYPCDHFKFIKQELINNIFTVTDYELFTDLIMNSDMQEAFSFAKKYKLFKDILA